MPAPTTIAVPNPLHDFDARRQLIVNIIKLIHVLSATLHELLSGIYSPRTPYHTSALSGHQWVLELICGHPERIKSELGLKKESFLQLIAELRLTGLTDSRGVKLEEQVAIFLYTCVTGLTTWHVGERFQRSNDTISRYFKKILSAVSSAPFYTKFIQFPTGELVSPKIRHNPKLWPYFCNAIGAIDGSHIPVAPPAHLHGQFRNRKGFLSQNALFTCDFDLNFTYSLTGWEGSAADARVYDDAISTDLRIPPGKYLLADAGYPLRPQLLVPYRGIRYHLAEWARASQRPKNKEELFNLRHASARNVIERIFGILKRRFRILHLPLEYKLEVQARLPAGLAALHNFIRVYEPNLVDDEQDEDTQDEDDEDRGPTNELPSEGNANATVAAECSAASTMRDHIAQEMWDSYVVLLSSRRDLEESDDDTSSVDSVVYAHM